MEELKYSIDLKAAPQETPTELDLYDIALKGDYSTFVKWSDRVLFNVNETLYAAAKSGNEALVYYLVDHHLAYAFNWGLEGAVKSGNLNLVKYFTALGATNLKRALRIAKECNDSHRVKYSFGSHDHYIIYCFVYKYLQLKSILNKLEGTQEELRAVLSFRESNKYYSNCNKCK